VIDEVVGELMRMRGELARAGNVANQAVREARKLDDETRKAMEAEHGRRGGEGDRERDATSEVDRDLDRQAAVIPNITRGGSVAGSHRVPRRARQRERARAPRTADGEPGVVAESAFRVVPIESKRNQKWLTNAIDAPRIAWGSQRAPA